MSLEVEVMRAELRVYQQAIKLASIALAQAVAEAKRQAARADEAAATYNADKRVKELEEFIRLHLHTTKALDT